MPDALLRFVDSDFDREATLLGLINSVKDARLLLGSESTPDNALNLCRCTRAVYLAIMDFCLDYDESKHIRALIPELNEVAKALEIGQRCNPNNADYIFTHLELAKRILSHVQGVFRARQTRNDSKHMFISYVSENHDEVVRIRDALNEQFVNVWLDRDDLKPGCRWKDAIKRAIRDGQFFLAVFSREYCSRHKTYMNEELTLAIEELRQRPRDRAWFIPVVLSPCEIPEIAISAVESLRDIHYVDLSKDWNTGIEKIIAVISNAPA